MKLFCAKQGMDGCLRNSYLRRKHRAPFTLNIWYLPLLPVLVATAYNLSTHYTNSPSESTKLEMFLTKFMDYTDSRMANTLSYHPVPDQRDLSKC